MKRLRQNILSMVAVAFFAMFVAVVESSFVYDYNIGSQATLELGGTTFNQNGSPIQPLFLSREASSQAVLLTRRASQQALSRSPRNGGFQGFCGRDASAIKQYGAHASRLSPLSTHPHSGFPTPLAYQASKEYYVFTLERILC
ncbi:MAG: hypothetical protein IJ909_07520 [Fibrobacter sp.]|jgi:hypothetical protein|nr:hypothetical protein [Fibrobacter sp.]